MPVSHCQIIFCLISPAFRLLFGGWHSISSNLIEWKNQSSYPLFVSVFKDWGLWPINQPAAFTERANQSRDHLLKEHRRCLLSRALSKISILHASLHKYSKRFNNANILSSYKRGWTKFTHNHTKLTGLNWTGSSIWFFPRNWLTFCFHFLPSNWFASGFSSFQTKIEREREIIPNLILWTTLKEHARNYFQFFAKPMEFW